MEYKKIELGGFNLHTIKTEETKYKKIYIEVFFQRKALKEETTIRSLLSKVLTESTNKYNTNRKMFIESEELYGAEIAAKNILSGYNNNLIFEMNFINEKYTELGMNERTLDFFIEMLFNPNINNNKFDSESFKNCKESLKEELISENDNPQLYSVKKMLENMTDSPASYNVVGYLEDLEKINESNLYDYYKTLFVNDIIDIYVVGDIDTDYIKEYFKNKFEVRTFKKSIETTFIKFDKFRIRPKKIKEPKQFNQSNLAIGFKIEDLNLYERQYVLPIFNYIYGGGAEAKLFQIIREKYSLCYSIHSKYVPSNSMLIVTSGINRDQFDKTTKLIKKIFKEMCKGKFTKEEFDVAVNSYKSLLKELSDSQRYLADSYNLKEKWGYDDIETRINNIDKVTIDDIVKISQKIKIDTIYLLEGVLDERN